MRWCSAGAGRAFSTGGDLSEFGTAPSPIVARWVRFRRDVWGLLRRLPIPTVAAIHGLTVGGGLEMALLCDLAIAADDTRICLPETGVGMIPGVAGTQTASRRLGLGRALDLCLTGRWIDAKEALLVGLVAEVVPAAKLGRAAHAMARSLSRLPRETIALAKLCVWDGLDLPLAAGAQDGAAAGAPVGQDVAQRVLRIFGGNPVSEHGQLRLDSGLDRSGSGGRGFRRATPDLRAARTS